MAATATVLLKFEPADLAAIDRVRADVPRAVWIKALCADAVLAQDVLHGILSRPIEQEQSEPQPEVPKVSVAERMRKAAEEFPNEAKLGGGGR